MPQHLLVAHDLSPQADIALARAALLGQRLGARISVLHVLTGEGDEAGIRLQLQQRLDQAGIMGAALHLRHSSAAAEGILCMLRGLEADLLLIGAHHSAHSSSTPEQLLQACPALLLCVQPADSDWQTALGLLDFSPCASRALRLARTLLADSAGLTALNVLERAAIHAQDDADELEFQRGLFEDLLAEEQQACTGAVSGDWQVGELHLCLQQAIERHQPQLLALGEHHRGLLADSLLGSLTLELLQGPPCDLLISR